HVEIRERDMPPERVDTIVPHNIVATKSGYITNMMVYEGQPLVKNGDSVLAGDILVSGIMEDVNGKNRTVHARAKIEAQIEDSLAVTVPFRRTVYVYKGFEQQKALHILSFSLPLGRFAPPPKPWKVEIAEETVPLLSRLLPVTVTRKNYLLLEEGTEEVTADEARLEAVAQLEKEEKRAFPEGSIISRDVTGQELDDSFILFADYIRIFDIAEEREILRDQEDSSGKE
ncbi:MAG: sporulation protein YqfD, partial [Angelakisella sp.]